MAAGTLARWQRLSSVPLGRRLFSLAVMARVPYFGTILPTVEAITPQRCVVRAPLWWGVHNHIKTFHAIAACNLAEITMGMLAEASVPPSHRWIPKSMTVEYLAKAKTGLRAVAELPDGPAHGTKPVDVEVPVSIQDKAGDVVVRAVITIRVSPKR